MQPDKIQQHRRGYDIRKNSQHPAVRNPTLAFNLQPLTAATCSNIRARDIELLDSLVSPEPGRTLIYLDYGDARAQTIERYRDEPMVGITGD